MSTIGTVTLSIGLLIALPAAATPPTHMTLGPGFQGPVEVVSPALKLTTTPAKFGVGFNNGSRHCWSKGHWISPKPAVSVEFTAETQAQLYLDIKGTWPGHSNTLIVLTPNNNYRCITLWNGREFDVWADTFKPGK